MNPKLKNLLLIGVIIEITIFLVSSYLYPESPDTFRYSARVSGRFSALLFIITIYKFIKAYPKPVIGNQDLRNYLSLFAVMHVIHFGFLATCVILNNIELIPAKVAGGALAYLMIVTAPFVFHKIKKGLQLTYFIFVGFVMIMTYVARINGDFEGADPFWFHYVAISAFIVLEIALVYIVISRKNLISS